MTKAKTAKTAADAKNTKVSIRTKAKAPAAAPKAEKKPAAHAARKPSPAKPSPKPSSKDKASRVTTRLIGKAQSAPPAPAPAAKPATGSTSDSARIAAGFGLGIKTATKKPALSVAPGVMILGRPAQTRQDTAVRPSERRLSKKEQADIRTFLLEKRERLLAGMRRELALQKERAESKAADEVDKATDAYDEDLSFEIATANDQELQDIQIALEKIEKGTYGECEICGCAISPSRLKILPSATTCVACRGQEEMSRRRDDGQQLFSMMEDEAAGEGEAL